MCNRILESFILFCLLLTANSITTIVWKNSVGCNYISRHKSPTRHKKTHYDTKRQEKTRRDTLRPIRTRKDKKRQEETRNDKKRQEETQRQEETRKDKKRQEKTHYDTRHLNKISRALHNFFYIIISLYTIPVYQLDILTLVLSFNNRFS